VTLSPELSALTFGIFAAASWGAGDFNGGIATKRLSVVSVVAIAHGVGFALVFALALLTQEAFPPLADLVLSAGAGLMGLVGLTGLYRALAHGQMNIAAPVSAVTASILPVIYSIFAHGLPKPLQALGFVVAFASIWLVSTATGAKRTGGGLGIALFAGGAFGLYSILIDGLVSTSTFWLISASRAFTFLLILMVVWRGNYTLIPESNRIRLTTFLAGVLDVLGNVFFVIATQSNRLDIASVSLSLYPVVTVLLARFILHEKMGRMQTMGVILAVVAVALIAM
jgi:drug/metabolite transporter (DMT)-like permease